MEAIEETMSRITKSIALLLAMGAVAAVVLIAGRKADEAEAGSEDMAYKIAIDQEGIYRVAVADLSGGKGLRLEDMNLYRRGKAVPILLVDGQDGLADPTGERSLIFYASRPEGRYSRESVYRLARRKEGERPCRFSPRPALSGRKVPEGESRFRTRRHLEKNLVYAPLPSEDLTYLGEGEFNPWFWTRVGEKTAVRFDLGPFTSGPRAPEVRLKLQGARWKAVRSEMDIILGEIRIPCSWSGGKPYEISFSAKSGELRPGANEIVLAGRRGHRGRKLGIYLDWIEIEFDQGREVNGTARIDISEGKTRLFSFKSTAGRPLHALELTRHERLLPAKGKKTGSGGSLAFESPGGTYFLFEADCIEKPLRIVPDQPSGLKSAKRSADFIIIALARFAEGVIPLARHRAAQGLRVEVVLLEDVFDEFSHGEFTPHAIKNFLRYAHTRWQRPAPRYVLLVGDATRDVGVTGPDEAMPTFLVDTYQNGATASDHPFVCFEKGDLPAMAIGRLVPDSPEDLRAMVDKIITYETKAPLGPWRRRLSFIAGEGRFGPAIDAAIEKMAVQMFCALVPYDYDVNMTYANPNSPYLYVPKKLSRKVVDRMSKGCLILNYIGHGWPGGFDRLRWRGKRYPIFLKKDVPKVATKGRNPIVVITACSTGHFDNPKSDSVSEELSKGKERAAAVFSATRISHPYANTVLSKELIEVFFAKRSDRLGDYLMRCKKAILQGKDKWRKSIEFYGLMFLGDPNLLRRFCRDEVYLYNLLGDPALRPCFPTGTVALRAEKQVLVGTPLQVTGTVSNVKSGRGEVTLEIERDKIQKPLKKLKGKKGSALERAIEYNYKVANDKVLLKRTVTVKDGGFRLVLKIPKKLKPGTYYIKCYARDGSGDATGSRKVVVKAPEAPPGSEKKPEEKKKKRKTF
jgi:hypothetical protein